MTALNANPHHDEWLAYYLARKPDHVMKLALILSVSRGKLRMGLAELQDAITQCDKIEDELASVFAARVDINRVAKLNTDVGNGILNGIKLSGGAMHERALWSFAVRYMDKRSVENLIATMVKVGWVVPRVHENALYYVLGENAPKQEETRH